MRRITLIPVRTSRETKGRIAIVAACIVAIVAVFADHELRPDPDGKGFCTFCNGPYKAMVLGAYGVAP